MSTVENGTCEIADEIRRDDLSVVQYIHLSFIVLSPLTIVLNIFAIVKINTRNRHKSVTRFLLSSLAVVDMCVGLLIMPLMIANEFYDVRNLLGAHTCLLAFSADVLLSSVSIIHLSLLTYERYNTVCKPFVYDTYCGTKRMVAVYLICWISVGAISFGIILPEKHLLGMDEQYLNCLMESFHACIFVMNVYITISLLVVTIFLPGILITCFHTKLVLTVRQNSLTRRNYQSNVLNTNKIVRKSKSLHVTKTISVLAVCFFVCWLPFFVVNLLNAIQTDRGPIELLIVQWLEYINSAVNPFLYLLLETKSCIGRTSTQL